MRGVRGEEPGSVLRAVRSGLGAAGCAFRAGCCGCAFRVAGSALRVPGCGQRVKNCVDREEEVDFPELSQCEPTSWMNTVRSW